jgi:hypothetical protein
MVGVRGRLLKHGNAIRIVYVYNPVARMGSGEALMRYLTASVLAIPILATIPYSVRPIEPPWDASLPAVTEWGDSFVLTREVKVETGSPRMGKGVGRLFVVFDRSTGYYLKRFYCARKEYPAVPTFSDWFKSHGHIGVTSKGIWAFDFQLADRPNDGGAVLRDFESNEKAESLDDAVSKALKWAPARIEDTEQGKPQPYGGSVLVRRFERHLDPANDDVEFVPQALVSFAWRSGLWEMTFDGYQRREGSYPPPGQRKPLRARLALASPGEYLPRYTCVDDKGGETTCP